MPSLTSLALLLTTFTAVASAQTSDDRNTWLQIQGAAITNPSLPQLKKSWDLGLAGGQWLTPSWGWEASFLRGTVSDQTGHWTSKVVHVDGSALFNPLPDLGRWHPFLRGGLGISGGVYDPPSTSALGRGAGLTGVHAAPVASATSATRLNLVAGAGLQTYFGQRGIVSLETRILSAQVSPSTRRNEGQTLVGLGFRWGETSPGSQPEAFHPPVPEAPLPEPEPAPAPRPVPPVPQPEPKPVPHPQPRPLPEPQPEPPRDPVIISGPVRREPSVRKFILDEATLHFTNGGADMGPEGVKVVRDVAAVLKEFPGKYRLTVTGHASKVGSAGLNRALSRKRAETVTRVLVRSGIPASRITTRGEGFDHPIASNATPKGQSRNRRVEIEVLTPSDVPVKKRRTIAPLAETHRKPAPKHAKKVRHSKLGS
jgi:outer membrane protein OmpA-like peptidoglycan-associated protein